MPTGDFRAALVSDRASGALLWADGERVSDRKWLVRYSLAVMGEEGLSPAPGDQVATLGVIFSSPAEADAFDLAGWASRHTPVVERRAARAR